MHVNPISRRLFLRGLGTAMALPYLEAMMPSKLFAATPMTAAFPKRLVFFYIPNGVNMADWRPNAVGAEFELPYILEPLTPLRSDVTVLSGLAHDKARPNGDGAGDHARASATFLTGCQARKTAGADIKVGVSVDQIVAQKIGNRTRLPSLELGCDRSQQAGNCDSGYSCAYSFNISWQTESTPLPAETNPRLVFERLFGNGLTAESQESRLRRVRLNQSILDFVLEDAQRLKTKLGFTDQHKLEEYFTSVREVEQRIDRLEQWHTSLPDYPKPEKIPVDYEQHLRIMMDLLALALQTDSTRIATFLMAHDGSNRPYPFIGVSEGHHDLSHHGNNEEKKKKIAKINHFHLTQLAYFLTKLKSIREGTGNLLDHSMVVYGSGISDGNSHTHNNLPVLLAGRGGGSFRSGRHLQYPKDTPMANLFLTLMDHMGVSVSRIGDSTKPLTSL